MGFICTLHQLPLNLTLQRSSIDLPFLSVFTGRVLPRACEVYEQSAMAEAEQDRTVLPPRGAGLSAEAGETFRTALEIVVVTYRNLC